jgi:hypothetical protein
MRAPLSRDPIVGLAIPPYAPPAVEESAAAFEPLGMKLEMLKDSVEVAERAIAASKKQDSEETVAALRAGKSRDPQLLESEARAELAALEAQLPSYRQAVDESGNAHAKVVAENIELWFENLDAPEAEARKQAEAALATLKDAARIIATTKAARAWLHEYNPNEAIVGRQRPFTARSIKVDTKRLGYNAPADVAALLGLVAEVLDA